MPSAILCSLSPQISRLHSSLFSEWRRTVSSKFFDAQVPSISTEEHVLPRQAHCVLSRLRCKRHNLLISLRLAESKIFCEAPASLRRSLFGDTPSLYDLYSRLWVVAWLLKLRGLSPCPHPSEGVG